MRDFAAAGAPHNPFCSENVRPGRIRYRFGPETGVQDVMARFESAGRVGQIVGPHGSGKSTLLFTLAESLRESGKQATVVVAPAGIKLGSERGTILLLDTSELLSPLRIRSLARVAAKRGGGLITTAHRDVGLPTLICTDVSRLGTLGIVEALLTESAIKPPESLVIKLREKHNGNMRMILFDLYDWYEDVFRAATSGPRRGK